MTDRLAELERQAAAIQSEIAQLKAGRVSPQPQPPKDDGVRIIAVNDERVDGLPNLREMQKLFAAVKHLAPWPLDAGDPDKPFRGFAASFRWLLNKGRSEQPNGKFALSFWIDNAKTWLRARNSVASDIDATTLVLAAYAQGDVRYVPANPALGYVWELGLAEHGGKPANADAWRRVLREGAASILPPSAPSRRDAPLSQVRVVSGY
jgi:hypothetical protein